MPSPNRQSPPFQQTEFDLFRSHERIFVNWDKPVLEKAVEHFTRNWSGTGLLDLSDHLIVVPTTHSGRRLREALAIYAGAKNGAAVIPPLVVTPDFFTSPERVSSKRFDRPVAAAAETLMVWTSLLLTISLDEFRHLFPVDPVERSLNWALKTASDLLNVRKLLGEAGMDFGASARILGNGEMEAERWLELALLEKRAVKATRDAGFFDTAEARRVAANEGELPNGIEKVTVFAMPDPSPLAVKAFERISNRVPLEIVIYASEDSLEPMFDQWGRPDPHEKWMNHHIGFINPEQTIYSEGSPTDQAEKASSLALQYPDPERMVAIGVPDVEIVAPLEKSLKDNGIGGFNPGGRSLSTHSLYFLLGILNQLATSAKFSAFLDLLRCPDVNQSLRNLIEEAGEEMTLSDLLDGFDSLSNDHLPETIDDAKDVLSRRNRKHRNALQLAVNWVEDWLVRFRRQNFGTVLIDFLSEIYSDREFGTQDQTEAEFASIADQINGILDAFESRAMTAFGRKLDAAEHFDLLLELLKGQTFRSERDQSDIDLQGWLELLWEDAPHLILTGMNDGRVPESIIGHAWLPDSARRILGLRHNDSRYARDVYLTAALVESRKSTGGRTDFIFGRIGETGDPLRPSRLLFHCPDDDLPDRISQFFDGHEQNRSSTPLPWELSWKLSPPRPSDDLKIFERLSVTSFRDYLECPFRFYLRHGLRMRSVEIQKSEMDSAEFGTLCHQVLQYFAEDEALSKSTKPTEIREYFQETVDRVLSRKYGSTLTVPVLIQRRGMWQRLDWWAAVEAEQRAAGWEIIGSELEISPRDPESSTPAFEIGGMRINGSIDRVERHPEFGIRIIDFKTFARYDTGNNLKSVEDYHIAKLKRNESPGDFPEWMFVEHSSGAPARWINLQLPLYKLAAQKSFPNEKITVAYGTIGKSKSEVTLHVWPELEAGTLRSARDCANGVIESVLKRQFWPPAEKVLFDDFSTLFFDAAAESVDSTSLL